MLDYYSSSFLQVSGYHALLQGNTVEIQECTFNSSFSEVRSGCSSVAAASTALSSSAILDSADVSQVRADIMFSWNCTSRVSISCNLSFLSSHLEHKSLLMVRMVEYTAIEIHFGSQLLNYTLETQNTLIWQANNYKSKSNLPQELISTALARTWVSY